MGVLKPLSKEEASPEVHGIYDDMQQNPPDHGPDGPQSDA